MKLSLPEKLTLVYPDCGFSSFFRTNLNTNLLFKRRLMQLFYNRNELILVSIFET